jgi:hypothetical protein
LGQYNNKKEVSSISTFPHGENKTTKLNMTEQSKMKKKKANIMLEKQGWEKKAYYAKIKTPLFAFRPKEEEERERENNKKGKIIKERKKSNEWYQDLSKTNKSCAFF